MEQQFPDLQERLDHIFHKQLFGIAITDLTAMLSRRSVYCSKYPASEFSVTQFDDKHADGNIRFKRIQHTWGKPSRDSNGNIRRSCIYCGASQNEYDRPDDLETHAYEWIHVQKPEEIFKMKFDVIIGNPPYQLSTGGSKAQATPLYDKFVERAKKLNPRFLTMIIPARWFSGGFGLDEFRKNMISDNKIRELHDFVSSTDCFGTGVEIKGGVCFFLWDKEYDGTCKVVTHKDGKLSVSNRMLCENGMDAFIRWNEGISVYHKVQSFREKSFMYLVSSQKPFGIGTAFHGKKSSTGNDVTIYENGGIGYIDQLSIPKNFEDVGKYKVFISAGYNGGDNYPHQILGRPIVGGPGTCCTETYVMIGPVNDIAEANNLSAYMQTKFFRFMVMLLKNTQHALKKVYQLAPQQDWTHRWTDIELYEKYGLSQEEIKFIDSLIKPMDGGNE